MIRKIGKQQHVGITRLCKISRLGRVQQNMLIAKT